VLALFAVFGRSGNRDRAVGAGVVMIVLAMLGLLVLGLASGILGILGEVFVLIGGLLYVVDSR
jgi:hypothetical protein